MFLYVYDEKYNNYLCNWSNISCGISILYNSGKRLWEG